MSPRMSILAHGEPIFHAFFSSQEYTRAHECRRRERRIPGSNLKTSVSRMRLARPSIRQKCTAQKYGESKTFTHSSNKWVGKQAFNLSKTCLTSTWARREKTAYLKIPLTHVLATGCSQAHDSGTASAEGASEKNGPSPILAVKVYPKCSKRHDSGCMCEDTK